MPNLVGIALIALVFPMLTFAATCAPNDVGCKTKQAQLKMMENTGVKPTEVTQGSPGPALPDPKNDNSKEVVPQQPFKIPYPPFAPRPTASGNAKDQNQSYEPPKPLPQAGSGTTLNIFAPSAGTVSSSVNSSDQADQEQGDEQEQKQDAVLKASPSTGMIYR